MVQNHVQRGQNFDEIRLQRDKESNRPEYVMQDANLAGKEGKWKGESKGQNFDFAYPSPAR